MVYSSLGALTYSLTSSLVTHLSMDNPSLLPWCIPRSLPSLTRSFPHLLLTYRWIIHLRCHGVFVVFEVAFAVIWLHYASKQSVPCCVKCRVGRIHDQLPATFTPTDLFRTRHHLRMDDLGASHSKSCLFLLALFT